MRLDDLREQLEAKVARLPEEQRDLVSQQERHYRAVFPFNEIELRVALLLANDAIDLGEYLTLRADYVAANKYLDLFALAPRVFGEVWAHEHVRSIDSRFEIPSKALDPEFNREYDLWIDGVRVELKAGRAIRKSKESASLVSRALHSFDVGSFWMNYQQLKCDCCDVFVFLGVWVDKIRYWVLSRDEASGNPFYSLQHRGGIEYQIGVTDKNIAQFDAYECTGENLASTILSKG